MFLCKFCQMMSKKRTHFAKNPGFLGIGFHLSRKYVLD